MPDIEKLNSMPVEDLLKELRAREAHGSDEKDVKAAMPAPNGELQEFDDKTLVEAVKDVQKVIYGTDNRREIIDVGGANRDDADSVVALFRSSDVQDLGNGTSQLRVRNFGEAMNLCPTERFRDQPIGAFCSGFLVEPDVVATAGHCANTSDVTSIRFVFGFRMRDAANAETIIDNDEIYRGASIIARELTPAASDWCLIKLDRSVKNHRVVNIRRSGKIADDAILHVIGHPVGLPTKFADGASVRDNTQDTFFSANLDTYGGNSGSPVFNNITHQVEGILVRGETDFVRQGDCNRSLVCPNSGCRGEDVTRTTVFAQHVTRRPELVLEAFGYNAGDWRVDRHPRFLADITGGGNRDIVGFANSGVWTSLSNGDGTFTEPQHVLDTFGYAAGGWQVDRHPRLLVDVNDNNRADIVGFGNAGVWIAYSNGDGTFRNPQLVVETFGYNAGGWRTERHPRFVASLTNGQDADIIGFRNAGVWIARNNGSGVFGAPELDVAAFGYNAGGWRVDMHPRMLAGVTGVVAPDIVGFGNAGVWVSENIFNNGFDPPLPPPAIFAQPQLVLENFGYNAGGWRIDRHPRFMADVTGNLRADIVGFGNAGVYVSLNDGNGNFAAPQRVLDAFGYNQGWRVDRHPRFMIDTTGSGRDDIVGFGDDAVWIALSRGDGTFDEPRIAIKNFCYVAGGWRVDGHPRFLGDVTSDSLPDIIGFGNAGVWLARAPF